MNAMRRFFLWYGLLSKRLLRRPAYLAVLLLVPLFCVAILFFSRQGSGVLTIALHCADPADSAASSAQQRLLDDEKSIIRYVLYDSESAARDAVVHGRADAAWIFSADTSEQLTRFARNASAVAVTVVEREDTVFLMVAREKLYGALYPDLSFAIFSHFLDADADEAPDLETYYHSGATSDEIMRFTYAGGDEIGDPDHYLLTPLRGILALLLMLSGFASAMYCYREERIGSFVWLSQGKRMLLPVLCHLTAILPAALAVYAAMALAGILTDPLRELLLLALLCLSAALFCELIRCLAGRPEHLGTLIPILMIAMVVLCPVFMDMRVFEPVQWMLPPYHYLRAVYTNAALSALALYTLILALVTLPVCRIRQSRI